MEDKKQETTVTIIKGGPLKLSGNFELADMSGKSMEFEGDDVYICRCGKSKNMPFCDGTHKTMPVPFN